VSVAPAVSCARLHKGSAHEHTGTDGAIRRSLRNGFTAYAVLSPATNSFCHRRLRIDGDLTRLGRSRLRKLDTSNGCQDHTVLPYAAPPPKASTGDVPIRRSRGEGEKRRSSSARRSLTGRPALPSDLRARRCRVHRIPSRVRDDRDTPLLSGRNESRIELSLPGWEAEYFFRRGWTARLTDLPVRANAAQLFSRSRSKAADNFAASASKLVMPGLVPGIHAFSFHRRTKDVDGRVKPGHDGEVQADSSAGCSCGATGIGTV
jgi:hypothetical protein